MTGRPFLGYDLATRRPITESYHGPPNQTDGATDQAGNDGWNAAENMGLGPERPDSFGAERPDSIPTAERLAIVSVEQLTSGREVEDDDIPFIPQEGIGY